MGVAWGPDAKEPAREDPVRVGVVYGALWGPVQVEKNPGPNYNVVISCCWLMESAQVLAEARPHLTDNEALAVAEALGLDGEPLRHWP
jgi:hypothetical protein